MVEPCWAEPEDRWESYLPLSPERAKRNIEIAYEALSRWRAAEDMRLSAEDERDLPTCIALGYMYVATPMVNRPLREYVLPANPFRRGGPFVIVTELVLDDAGHRVGQRKILRWMPKRRVARYA